LVLIFFLGVATAIMPDLGVIWSRQALTGCSIVSFSVIMLYLGGNFFSTLVAIEFSSIIVYLLDKDDTIHSARESAMRAEFAKHLEAIAEPPSGESRSSGEQSTYTSYLHYQKERRDLRSSLIGNNRGSFSFDASPSRTDPLTGLASLEIALAENSTQPASGRGSGGGFEVRSNDSMRIKFMRDSAPPNHGVDESRRKQLIKYHHMRLEERKAYKEEIRFNAHFTLTLLRAGLFSRDFEVRAKVEAAQLTGAAVVTEDSSQKEDTAEEEEGILRRNSSRGTWKNKVGWVNSNRESFKTEAARQIWALASAKGYTASKLSPHAMGCFTVGIRSSISSILIALNVYCDVYAIPSRPDSSNKKNYVSQENWDLLFGLGADTGRTILDLRDDLTELNEWLGKLNNDRQYPYIAASVVDGINFDDFLNLFSSRKQRESKYKELKDDVGFSTFWDRMTEIAKESPQYKDSMASSTSSNYAAFGNDIYGMINSFRDAGFMEMCDEMHSKTLGLPNTDKGIISALEKTGDELCTQTALDLIWEFVWKDHPEGITWPLFERWMSTIKDGRTEHYGELEKKRIFDDLTKTKENNYKAQETLSKELWCDPDNFRRLGEGRFPQWKAMVESVTAYEQDSEKVVQVLRKNSAWVAAERLLGRHILEFSTRGDDEDWSDGIIGEISDLMCKGKHTPANKAIVFQNWEFDADTRMQECKAKVGAIIQELEAMGLMHRIKHYKGKLPNLEEYFSAPSRVDYNACFLAAEYLNRLVSQGEEANRIQENIMEVSLIRDRLVMGTRQRQILNSDELRKIYYLNKEEQAKKKIEANKNGEQQAIYDAQSSGKLKRVPIKELENEEAASDDDDEIELSFTRTGHHAQSVGAKELPQVKIDEALKISEGYTTYIFNTCLVCSSTIEFYIQGIRGRNHDHESLEKISQGVICQEVVHFLIRFPLTPINPAKPKEPVIAFNPIPNAFIVRGLDAKDKEQIHVFYATSDEERDRWVAILNSRSQRYVDHLKHNFEVAIEEEDNTPQSGTIRREIELQKTMSNLRSQQSSRQKSVNRGVVGIFGTLEREKKSEVMLQEDDEIDESLWETYISYYDDLIDFVGHNKVAALDHWYTKGKEEGRIWPTVPAVASPRAPSSELLPEDTDPLGSPLLSHI